MLEICIIVFFLYLLYKFVVFRKAESLRLFKYENERQMKLVSHVEISENNTPSAHEIIDSIRKIENRMIENQKSTDDKLGDLRDSISAIEVSKHIYISNKQFPEEIDLLKKEFSQIKVAKMEGIDVHDELAKRRTTRLEKSGEINSRKNIYKEHS